MKKLALISAAVLGIGAAVLFWMRTPKPEGRCKHRFSYDVKLRQSQSTGAVGMAQDLLFRPRIELSPVATSPDSVLFKMKVTTVTFQGYPEGADKVGEALQAAVYFVDIDTKKGFSIWGLKHNTPAVVANLAKYAIENFSFQRSAGTVLETDGMGVVQVQYQVAGNKILKKRIQYTQVHHPSPMPKILEAEQTIELDANGLPERTHSRLKYQRQWDPARGPADFLLESDIERKDTISVDSDAASTCETTPVVTFLSAKNLSPVNPAFEFDAGVRSQAPVPTSASDLLKALGKQSDPIKTLEELSRRIEQMPHEAEVVKLALEKLSGNEERSAHLISALSNAEVPEAQAAMRKILDFYLKGNKERLAIRTMRSQQLADYVDRASVENLVSISENRTYSPRIQQAALLASGGAAKVLNDEGFKESLRSKWEDRARSETRQMPKAEVLSALGNLAVDSSVPYLGEVARADKGYIGNQALDALRLIRTPESEKILAEAAIRDAGDERRRSALSALEFRGFSEATCKQLVARYYALLQIQGTSSVSERMQILSALGQPDHKGYVTVVDFLNGLEKEGRLTVREKEFVQQLRTTGF